MKRTIAVFTHAEVYRALRALYPDRAPQTPKGHALKFEWDPEIISVVQVPR